MTLPRMPKHQISPGTIMLAAVVVLAVLVLIGYSCGCSSIAKKMHPVPEEHRPESER